MKNWIEKLLESLSEEDRRRLEWAGKADRWIGIVLLAAGTAFLTAHGITSKAGLILTILSLFCFWRNWVRFLYKR